MSGVLEPFYRGDRLIDPAVDMSGLCAGRGPNHGVCTGWIAPAASVVGIECLCECHETDRMSYEQAKEAARSGATVKTWLLTLVQDDSYPCPQGWDKV